MDTIHSDIQAIADVAAGTCSTHDGGLEQSLAGVLYEPLKDKRYMQTVQKIAERLV